ncbi:uncharacterized protein N7529_007594, partial [Penicillium soppii]|uniref:uncharacterized protein n=1 Tax=Penicillium soppii TaxID=69789 RepID=UPI002547757C
AGRKTVALKTINACHARETSCERAIEEHIKNQNASHCGCVILRTCSESFNLPLTFSSQLLGLLIPTSESMQSKVDPLTGRTAYRCNTDLGPLDWRELKNMAPKISDYGLSTIANQD